MQQYLLQYGNNEAQKMQTNSSVYSVFHRQDASHGA